MEIYIKEALKELKIGRTTFYGRLEQLWIKTKKDWTKSYITPEDLELIKVKSNQPASSDKSEHSEEFNRLKWQLEEKTKQLEQANRSLETVNNQNLDLAEQLWAWKGRAATLEEQNKKLLLLEEEKKPKKWFFSRIFGS